MPSPELPSDTQLPTSGPSGSAAAAAGTRRPESVPLPAHLAHLRRDERGYPILVTIPQSLDKPDFGMLSDRRKLAAATFDVCGVCALPFTPDELRWQVSFANAGDTPVLERTRLQQHPLGGDMFPEAPLHEICALYAAQVCPFVSSPYARHSHTELRGLRRSDVVVLVGYDDTRYAEGGVIGADLPGGGQVGLMFLMGERVAHHELGSRTDATRAYAAALAAEQTPVLTDLDVELAAHFARDATGEEEDRTATGLAGGAYIAGAAFAPHLEQIVTLEMFTSPDLSWNGVSTEVLLDPDVAAELGKSAQFPEVTTALAWFDARLDNLPTPLRTWRDVARRAFARAQGAPPTQVRQPRADPGKSKRKAAKSSRRKNRR